MKRETIERIKNGRTDLVIDHVHEGGAADATDDAGVPLVRWCTYYGDVSALRFLLDHGARLDALGKNLDLNGAAFHGHWRLCEFLLERGADPNLAQAANGETPLHVALSAARRPSSELVVQVLLAAGADPRRVTQAGAETDCFMRDCRTRGETPLHRAAAFASESTIRRLLDAGADVEARDTHGDTPLSWASWHLRPDSLLHLLCYGEHRIHPERLARPDQEQRGAMEVYLLGKPVSDGQ